MSYEPPGGAEPPSWQQPQPPAPPPTAPAAWPPPPQPGPMGYSYPPQGLPPVRRPIKGLATAVTVLLIACALCSLFVAIALFHRASVVEDVGSTFQDVSDADDSAAGSLGFLVAAMLATGITWIVWQYRHGQNAERLAGTTLPLRPGWAIGGWFIPFANLIVPQLQLYQSAQASDRAPRETSQRSSVPSVFWVWAVLYDAAWILGVIGRMTRPRDDANVLLGAQERLDRFVRADRLTGICGLLFVAAAIAGIVLVRRLTQRQDDALDASFGRVAEPSTMWPNQPAWPQSATQPYPKQPYPQQQYPPPPPQYPPPPGMPPPPPPPAPPPP